MGTRDLHVHTSFSDGSDSPEAMVQAALEAGLETVGITDHSYTFFDESYCIPKAQIPAYLAGISELKERYRGKIEVLCGIEQDYYSECSTREYDYVIGSVHYLKLGAEYVPVDEDAETLLDAAKRYFDGDFYALAEEYYRILADVVRKTGADIIGHFDLISKFIERTPLFDPMHPRYIAAWKAAADALLETGVPFEINAGAITRGYRTECYPSRNIRSYLASHGAVFVYGSDSHSAEALKKQIHD